MNKKTHSLNLDDDKSAPSSPSPFTERGIGGEVNENPVGWHTSPGLWKRLKPLARQMRKEPTEAEAVLWSSLHNRRLLGFKFRRQHSIERFIVDFYCSEAMLVVEVDGQIHQYSREEDLIRQEYMEMQGIKVLRFTNEEVIDTPDKVTGKICEILNQREKNKK